MVRAIPQMYSAAPAFSSTASRIAVGPAPLRTSIAVTAFSAAMKSGDEAKVKDYLTANDRAYLEAPGPAAVFTKRMEYAKTQEYEIGAASMEGDSKALVHVTVKTPGRPDTDEDLVLTKEEGKWKIDLKETFVRSYIEEMKKRGIQIPPSMMKRLGH